jgi:hypothetical protein
MFSKIIFVAFAIFKIVFSQTGLLTGKQDGVVKIMNKLYIKKL